MCSGFGVKISTGGYDTEEDKINLDDEEEELENKNENKAKDNHILNLENIKEPNHKNLEILIYLILFKSQKHLYIKK